MARGDRREEDVRDGERMEQEGILKLLQGERKETKDVRLRGPGKCSDLHMCEIFRQNIDRFSYSL